MKKSRMQLDKELYEIIKGKDTKLMSEICYNLFKKKTLGALNNEQMETLIEEVRKAYAS